MGKVKKGKKGGKEEGIDEDGDTESLVAADDGQSSKGKKSVSDRTKNSKLEEDLSEDEISSKKSKGKKEKKKKKGNEEDEDEVEEITKSLEKSNLKEDSKKKKKDKVSHSASLEHSDEEVSLVKKSSKGKKGFDAVLTDESDEDSIAKPAKKQTKVQKKKGGFDMLEIESGGDSDNLPDDEVSEKLDKIQTKNNKNKNDNALKRTDSLEDEETKGERTKSDKGARKGKKSKKKRDEDEEDIDKVLAELEMEYSGVKKESTPPENVEGENIATIEADKEDLDIKKDKKKKKKKDKSTDDNEVEQKTVEIIDGEEVESTLKTAAQKKKEKKERDRLKKLAAKQESFVESVSEEVSQSEEIKAPAQDESKPGTEDSKLEDEGEDDKKKKKKKGSKDAVKESESDKSKDKKGPGKKMIAAMQEALKKIKDDEEKARQEEDDRIKRLEEAEKLKEEQARLERERKELKKQREKERKERLKAEGKYLTPKQKMERARALTMLESLKAQGLDVPAIGEKKPPRPGGRIRTNKSKQHSTSEPQQQKEKDQVEETKVEQKVEVEIVDPVKAADSIESKEVEEEQEDVKDAWDAESSSSSEEEDKSETLKVTEKGKGQQKSTLEKEEEGDSEEEEDESESDDDSNESSDEDSDSSEDHKTEAERKTEKARARIMKRREDAEVNRTLDTLRAAVVCVLGHVDTGKTKILDKLRRTNVQDGEAGGITQQIGATNVPMDAIKEQTRFVEEFQKLELKIPGLLIIDTPGHESFSNLRSRGSSLCDIAILVVDIMHGLEPQTIESLNMLKARKTPFIVALNKIDRLYDWQTMLKKDVRDVVKGQAANTQIEFGQRAKETILQFAEQGFNAALFYENPDPRTYVSLVPTSAITGEGMGNLLALIVDCCQNLLAKRLMYSEELQATVLEVKAIPGLGTTIDAILINGKLKEGDTMVLAGTDGPIVTQIRSLLMPQPMKELRVKNAYVEYKEIIAAQGVKVAAKDLEKAIAGLNLLVAQKRDEIDVLREEVTRELKSALSNIKLQERGVYVQASTLGSLEALLEFLKTSKIPYCNIRIGPVARKDVMKASTMLEHDVQYATILAFDVKVERDAQEMADSVGVKIFQADIIYHLFDKFIKYRDELKQKKRDEFKNIAVFPCKLKILPQFIFNSRDPIVMGVMVEAGIVKEGTPICVPSKEFVYLGIVTSIESNHKNVPTARKGMEVCVKIEATPGESPKMFGRHFDEKDFLVSKISRESIDACKNYFRDDLIKTDWQLMVELKKLFQIL